MVISVNCSRLTLLRARSQFTNLCKFSLIRSLWRLKYLYQIVKRKNAHAEQIAEYIYRISHLSLENN